MTPIAPLITGFLREHLPVTQGYSPHTCDTYAHAFRLLFTFASARLGRRPSHLGLEQLAAALVLAFLSQAHVAPDITMEIFFVDRPLDGFGALEISELA